MYKMLQVNLMIPSGWLVKQQMKFNIGKCKETQIGKNNRNYTYSVIESKLAIAQGRILGVTVDGSLKMSAQCSADTQ